MNYPLIESIFGGDKDYITNYGMPGATVSAIDLEAALMKGTEIDFELNWSGRMEWPCDAGVFGGKTTTRCLVIPLPPKLETAEMLLSEIMKNPGYSLGSAYLDKRARKILDLKKESIR